MSFTISPNYFGGEFSKGLFAPALTKQRDLNAGLFRIVNGKARVIVPAMAHSNVVQVGSTCTVTPTNTHSMSEVRMDLIQLVARGEMCKDDLINSNYGMDMGRGVYNDEIVQEVLVGYLNSALGKMNDDAARLRWVGSISGGDAMDGIVTLLNASASTVKVTATPITAANVIAEMQKVIDAAPVAVRYSSDFKLVVSPAVLSAYQAAVTQQVGFATWAVGNVSSPNANDNAFRGYFGPTQTPIYLIPQLDGTSVMVAGVFADSNSGNFVLGTDALLDFGNIILHDRQTVNPLDTKIEFGMSVRQAVAVMDYTQAVLYI